MCIMSFLNNAEIRKTKYKKAWRESIILNVVIWHWQKKRQKNTLVAITDVQHDQNVTIVGTRTLNTDIVY